MEESFVVVLTSPRDDRELEGLNLVSVDGLHFTPSVSPPLPPPPPPPPFPPFRFSYTTDFFCYPPLISFRLFYTDDFSSVPDYTGHPPPPSTPHFFLYQLFYSLLLDTKDSCLFIENILSFVSFYTFLSV